MELSRCGRRPKSRSLAPAAALASDHHDMVAPAALGEGAEGGREVVRAGDTAGEREAEDKEEGVVVVVESAFTFLPCSVHRSRVLSKCASRGKWEGA